MADVTAHIHIPGDTPDADMKMRLLDVQGREVIMVSIDNASLYFSPINALHLAHLLRVAAGADEARTQEVV